MMRQYDWVCAYVVIVKDGQPAHVELVADACRGREDAEIQPVNRIAEVLAQSQGVQLKVDLEQGHHNLQHRLLLPGIVCSHDLLLLSCKEYFC